MPIRDKHENRFFEELKEYSALYPSVIPRLERAAKAGNPHVMRAVRAFADASIASETSHIARCRARFDLTETQARIAIFLAEGGTVAEYAAAMKISVATVRTHLKAIFAKTGAKRQAELAILMLQRER
jgi:DNA-binding CsgD family transcriptional regulator